MQLHQCPPHISRLNRDLELLNSDRAAAMKKNRSSCSKYRNLLGKSSQKSLARGKSRRKSEAERNFISEASRDGYRVCVGQRPPREKSLARPSSSGFEASLVDFIIMEAASRKSPSSERRVHCFRVMCR